MYQSIDELCLELKVALKQRDFNISDSNDDMIIMKSEIKKAIATINNCRRYVPTSEKPYPLKYEHLIIPLCLCSYSKIGAEGESQHSENGVVRTYTTGGDYPKDILMSIVPLVK